MTSSTSPQTAEPYRFSTLAAYVDTLDDVTDGHVEGFHEQGYIAVRRAVDAETAAAAAQAMWDLADCKNPDFAGIMVEESMEEEFPGLSGIARRNAVRKIMGFVDYDERLKALSEHAGILSVVQRLMGEPPVLFQEMGLMKPPRGRQKPWHQDCAYFTASVETTIVGVWIALDSATAENGCLHLIPWSHREGPQSHFKLLDWQVCNTEVPVERSVMVPLEPGGCLFWHGLTLHGSPTNRSNEGRRALQFHYEPESIRKITDEERLEIYGGEGQGVEC